MTTQFFGERIKRNEDPRLLTGQALFTDDVHLPGTAHAAFVRSPHSHARILSIDTSMAREMEGVVAVYTAEDLGDYWQRGPLLVSPPPIKNIVFNEKTQVPLARNKVNFVGEPVVLVVAESRYIAEDAAEQVWVDYEPLPCVVDVEKGVADDAPIIHEDIGSNVAAHVVQRKMRFVGDSEGQSQSAPGNIPRKALDMLMQLLTARQSGPEARQLLDILKSVPQSINNMVPEFRQLEKMMAALKQLDPAIVKAFSEQSDIPLETRLKIALFNSDPATTLPKLLSMQADGDMKTLLQRLGQMLKDPGLVNSLSQSGLKASDLENGIDTLLRSMSGKNEIKSQLPGDPDAMAAALQKNVPARFLDMLAQLSNARLSTSEFKLFLNMIRALPGSVRAALPELKNLEALWDTQQLDGKLIKAFVEKSGIAFETRLTIAVLKDPGQVLQSLLALQTEGDFKSLLLKLKRLLGDRSVSAELRKSGFKGDELSKTVEKFLDNVEFYQLTSKLNDMLYTFLPIVWDGLHDGELMFKRNKGQQKNSYTCDINLDLESLGRLSVSITIADRQFFVTFFTDSEETEHLIHVHKHLLQERFSSQGLKLAALNLGRKREISFGRSHLKGVNVKI